MLFPQIPIEELKKGDEYLDTDGNRWNIVGKLDKAEMVVVESAEAADDPEGGGVYSDSLEYGDLVTVDRLYRQFTAGRCRRCEILYVWPRRHRVLVSRAICVECRRPIRQTTPASLDPYGKTARFQCPLGG